MPPAFLSRAVRGICPLPLAARAGRESRTLHRCCRGSIPPPPSLSWVVRAGGGSEHQAPPAANPGKSRQVPKKPDKSRQILTNPDKPRQIPTLPPSLPVSPICRSKYFVVVLWQGVGGSVPALPSCSRGVVRFPCGCKAMRGQSGAPVKPQIAAGGEGLENVEWVSEVSSVPLRGRPPVSLAQTWSQMKSHLI